MNTIEIINTCKDMYKRYTNNGRRQLKEDDIILNAIIGIYNTSPIDWEEVEYLWENYLKTGNLYVSETMEIARKRMQTY